MPNGVALKTLCQKFLRNDRGAALIQVVIVSAFLIAMGYALMHAMSRADQRSQNIVTKTNFVTLSEYLQQQAVDTDGLIQSNLVTTTP